MNRIKWCTSHYSTDFTKAKAKELRSRGYKVSFGSYVKEDNKSYCKIYLDLDLNYHVINIIDMISFRIKHNKEDVTDAVNNEKEKLKDVCKRFSTPVRIEYDNVNVIAVVNNKYELKSK